MGTGRLRRSDYLIVCGGVCMNDKDNDEIRSLCPVQIPRPQYAVQRLFLPQRVTTLPIIDDTSWGHD